MNEYFQFKLIDQFQIWTEAHWDRVLTRSLSFRRRLLISIFALIAGVSINLLLKKILGVHFVSVTMLTIILITIYGGIALSIASGITITLIEDFLYIGEVGKLFDSAESFNRFTVRCVVLIFINFLMVSIRIAYNNTLKAKQESEKARKDAERANLFKSEFLSNMSHDIRTPINGIIGMSELMAKTELNGTQAHYLESMVSCSKNLLSLINDILDLNKMEAGRLQIQQEHFDLDELVQEISRLFKPIADERGLEFETLFVLVAPPCFVGDRHRIHQVLNNLIGNALKFTAKGKVTFEVIVGEVGEDGKSKVVFSITDTGIGISKELKSQLFQKYSHGKHSTARRYGGSGLGLAICKQLVELMGGSIGYLDNKGNGSTFYFTLNLKQEAASALDKLNFNKLQLRESFLRKSNKKLHQQSTILLAEDEVINQEIALTMLRNAGYQVDLAENGVEVVNAVHKKKYSLILMDCQMPEMNGFEATKQLRSEGLTLPIIAATAYAFPDDQEKCRLAGMTDYLTKPFAEQSLLEMVHRHIQIQDDELVVIDPKYIKSLAELDSETNSGLVEKLIRYYLETAQASVEKIKQSATGSDIEQLSYLAHKFKSSNASLGLLKVKRILERLEEGDASEVQYLATMLDAEVQVAIEALKNSNWKI